MRSLAGFRSGASAGALLALSLAAVSPGTAAGQVVGGVVLEQVSLAPARGAVVTMLRVDLGTGDMEPAAVTTADVAGAFVVELPGPGAYRAQADAEGLTSPLSPPLEVTAADTLLEFSLVVPSRLLAMAYACAEEAEAASAVLVGHVRDPATEVALPSARVTASWRDGALLRWGDAEADAAGRYRICGVAPAARGRCASAPSSWAARGRGRRCRWGGRPCSSTTSGWGSGHAPRQDPRT